MEYDPFAMLSRAVAHIAAGRTDEAREVLMRLVNECIDLDDRPHELTAFLFALALFKRLDADFEEQKNIYLRQYGVSQINLFALLVTQVPFVAKVYDVANTYLRQLMAGVEHPILVDVGMGKGWQEVHLLEALAEHGQLPEGLTIYGIEPDAQSLAEAKENIEACGRRFGLDIAFHPHCSLIEGIDEALWHELGRFPERTVLNQTFTLHHLAFGPDGQEWRDHILHRLAALNARGLVVSEPNSDHHEPDLVKRFHNCWHHFGLAFEVLEELDTLSSEDGNLLKIHFFGREIEDILGNREALRCERHEPTTTWLRRVREAGFVPFAPAFSLEAFAAPVIDVVAKEDHISLEYRGETLVGIFGARGPHHT